MNLVFGTDGVRGPAGRFPITAEGGVRIGRAAARLARSLGGDTVVVGRDTRASGPTLEVAVVAGITAEGATALRASVVPTAAVAFAVEQGRGVPGRAGDDELDPHAHQRQLVRRNDGRRAC